MRYAIETNVEGVPGRDHVSNYQVKLYKELRSLARLGIPARRATEPVPPHVLRTQDAVATVKG